MRLGVTLTIDCAHHLPGHAKCGRNHGHTYSVELVIEGEAKGRMVVDFADLKRRARAVLDRYDHGDWNDHLDYPSVENICEKLATELRAEIPFPLTLRVYEGRGKWAEM